MTTPNGSLDRFYDIGGPDKGITARSIKRGSDNYKLNKDVIPDDTVYLDPSSFTSADNGTFPGWDETADEWVNATIAGGTGISVAFNRALSQWVVTYTGGAGGGGIAVVTSDATLTGEGTTDSPLAVAKPVTETMQQLADDVVGARYAIVTGATAVNSGTANPATEATARGYTYGDSIGGSNAGLQRSNRIYYHKLPAGTPLGNYATWVGDSDLTDIFDKLDALDNWTAYPNNPYNGEDYYRVTIPDKPAANEVYAVLRTPRELRGIDIPFARVDGVPDFTRFPEFRTTMPPKNTWRLGLQFYNGSGGLLDYQRQSVDLAITVASNIGHQIIIPTNPALDSTGHVREIVLFDEGYTGQGSGTLAGNVAVLLNSGGASTNNPTTLTYNGVDYTVGPGFVPGLGQLYLLVNGLASDVALMTLRGHPPDTASIDWLRGDGTYLNGAGKCPEGQVVYNEGEWFRMTVDRREVLVDYSTATSTALTTNTFTELPAAYWGRDLTEADDERDLNLQFSIARSAGSDRGYRSTAIVIPANEWRNATAVLATDQWNERGKEAWTFACIVSDSRDTNPETEFYWTQVAVAKGPNGRPALCTRPLSLNSVTVPAHCRAIKAWLK